MTPEDLIDLEVKLNTLVDVTTKQLSAVAGNVVGVRVNPPDYMLRELIQLLQK